MTIALFPARALRLFRALALVAVVPVAVSPLPAEADGPERPTRQNVLVIEPEHFSLPGPWGSRRGGFIQSSGRNGVAFGGFEVPADGVWHVWTLTRDFAKNSPGSRNFRIKINDTPATSLSGTHGKEGWHWERVLTLPLAAGQHILEIEDIGKVYARLDAVLLTTTRLDPNTPALGKGSPAFRRSHAARLFTEATRIYTGVRVPEAPATSPDTSPDAAPPAASPAAVLKNPDIALSFRAVRAADGSPRIHREASLPSVASAIPLGMEPLLVLHSAQNPRINTPTSSFPAWQSATAVQWRLADRVFSPPADSRDPYASGILRRLHPVAARQIAPGSVAPGSVAVTYRETSIPPDLPGGLGRLSRPLEATLTWTLPPRGHAARLEVSFRAPQAGYYSLAFGAGRILAANEIHAVQLPPLFQFRRVVDTPWMIMSSQTPHPLALVEIRLPGTQTSVTTGVISSADVLLPSDAPSGASGRPDWARNDNSAFGFTLTASDGNVQPVIFTPLMGFADSFVQNGGALNRSWWVLTSPGSWADAMREADLTLLGLRDYREPWKHSLTDQALNIIELMRDDEASGWDARLKGPLNIEAPGMVTHASPLTLFSAARLTRDEDFFRRRALPALEFMLTRPSFHFALETHGSHYLGKNDTALNFEKRPYGSVVWQGLDDQLGAGLNPWLASTCAFPEGRPRKVRYNPGRAAEWADLLALHRRSPSEALLAEIRAKADAWIVEKFAPDQTRHPGTGPFYNAGDFYPWWWDLLDLYELTREPRYRDAAVRGAEFTVAGLWVTPSIPAPGDRITLYPGNKAGGTHHTWYLPDGTVGRRGWPRPSRPSRLQSGSWQTQTFSIPQKDIPAWVVSPVGLGLEQPGTYVRAGGEGGYYSNILLSTWAANLLRLHGATGDDYWRIFARNTIIGRGASYPGYYLAGYLDLIHDPDYTRRGPDLTSFYWHHIPVHLGMVLDYLFTDTEVRTGGKVRFPWSKQQGYVWFTQRTYGGAPGRVLDDADCWPWLDRTAFRVSTPGVDYLGARSREKFHLILLNQAQGDTTAPVRIDAPAIGLTSRKARLATANGASAITLDANGQTSVELPKNAWAVLTFDAKPADFWPEVAPLPAKAAPLRHALGQPFGDVMAFRTRTPFGKDSLYLALSGKPDDGTRVELLFEGDSSGSRIVDKYPYELGVYPWPMEKTARFRLKITTPDGKETTTRQLSLPGGSAR
ncbi:MAG: hypothetical protein LBK99_10140 [Opitutaceae bacterium]|jgi:hypothetical protein|nr:hypothetical protein [Opitutaceae bacterium]